MKFASNQSGPRDSGMSAVPGNLRSKLIDERQHHTMEYLPWIRQYRITYVPTAVVFRIHENRVDWSMSLDEWKEAERATKARKENR
jgi:hypothetical protein